MYSYNDGALAAGRQPRLYLAKGGEAVKFVGENIPGYCAVATAQYEKNGKWSNTTYQLELFSGVRPLYFASPMHGVWGDNLASWGEVAQKLGLPVEVAQKIVREEYPRTERRLDELEEFAQSLPQGEIETVIVSFGSPSNRQIAEGWWDAPKSATTSWGAKVVVQPGGEKGWASPEVIEPKESKIISSRSSPGMHGGYVTVEVAVPTNNPDSEEEGLMAQAMRKAGLV